jgi:hypothetical protein
MKCRGKDFGRHVEQLTSDKRPANLLLSGVVHEYVVTERNWPPTDDPEIFICWSEAE